MAAVEAPADEEEICVSAGILDVDCVPSPGYWDRRNVGVTMAGGAHTINGWLGLAAVWAPPGQGDAQAALLARHSLLAPHLFVRRGDCFYTPQCGPALTRAVMVRSPSDVVLPGATTVSAVTSCIHGHWPRDEAPFVFEILDAAVVDAPVPLVYPEDSSMYSGACGRLVYLPPGLNRFEIWLKGTRRLQLRRGDVGRLHALGWYFFPLTYPSSRIDCEEVLVEYAWRQEGVEGARLPPLSDVPSLQELPTYMTPPGAPSLRRVAWLGALCAGRAGQVGGTLVSADGVVMHRAVGWRHLGWGPRDKAAAALTYEQRSSGWTTSAWFDTARLTADLGAPVAYVVRAIIWMPFNAPPMYHTEVKCIRADVNMSAESVRLIGVT